MKLLTLNVCFGLLDQTNIAQRGSLHYMPQIVSSDGFFSKVRFQMSKFDGIKTAYLSGDLNCWGEGSIVLSGEDSLSVDVTLPPGHYNYTILINQYQRYLESGRPSKKRSSIELGLGKVYHNPDLSQFSCISQGLMELRVAVPKATKKIELLCKGNTIKEKRVKLDKYDLGVFFVNNPGDYAFVVDDKRYPAQGNFSPKNETRKLYDSSGIIYHIFPDRFNRSEQSDGRVFEKWGAAPKYNNFFGGNIKGITEKLGYLQSIGAEFLYINPIFKANSNHRYDVSDYYEVDPILGDMQSLKELVQEAHRKGMKIILDMVFNHSSTTFAPFLDVIKNGTNSKFFDWYLFHSNDFRVYRGRYKPTDKNNEPSYETFMGHGLLPKLNHLNKEVRNYFRGVIRYYAEEIRVDGFRFDVAHSMFLDFFRELNEDFDRRKERKITIGEAWCLSPLFFREKYWNSVTNYYLRDAIISYVNGSIDISEFDTRLEKYIITTGRTEIEGVMNILDSHDTIRILNKFKGSLNRVKLAFAILYLLNGLPTIYYGDEVGLHGGRDPDDRRCFPWEKIDSELLVFFKNLADFRMRHDIGYGGAISCLSNSSWDALIRYRKKGQIRLYVPKKLTKLPENTKDSLVVKRYNTASNYVSAGDFFFTITSR